VDLVGKRNRERVAFDRSAIRAGVRLLRDERTFVATAGRAREGAGAKRCLAGTVGREPPVAGESPRAGNEHPDSDSLAFRVDEVLDRAVLGGDELRSARDDACVGVISAGAAGRIDGSRTQVPHGLENNLERSSGPRYTANPSGAGGGIGRRARLRALCPLRDVEVQVLSSALRSSPI